MEAERKNAPMLSKSKLPVKTERGSQSVVFTYFQGDMNSVIDEHFSRALRNAKNPQDLSTKQKSDDVNLKNDGHMSPHQWNVSSHWIKSYQSPPATNASHSSLRSLAAANDLQQASVLQSRPIQPVDLWPFPSINHSSLNGSGDPRSSFDSHMVQGLMTDGKYGSLLDLLQQDKCPASSQESIMKQGSSSACFSEPARSQNECQSLTPMKGMQPHERRPDLYF